MLALTENVCVLIGYKGLEPFQFCIHLFIYLPLLELPSVSFACKLGLKHFLSLNIPGHQGCVRHFNATGEQRSRVAGWRWQSCLVVLYLYHINKLHYIPGCDGLSLVEFMLNESMIRIGRWGYTNTNHQGALHTHSPCSNVYLQRLCEEKGFWLHFKVTACFLCQRVSFYCPTFEIGSCSLHCSGANLTNNLHVSVPFLQLLRVHCCEAEYSDSLMVNRAQAFVWEEMSRRCRLPRLVSVTGVDPPR